MAFQSIKRKCQHTYLCFVVVNVLIFHSYCTKYLLSSFRILFLRLHQSIFNAPIPMDKKAEKPARTSPKTKNGKIQFLDIKHSLKESSSSLFSYIYVHRSALWQFCMLNIFGTWYLSKRLQRVSKVNPSRSWF